MFEFVVGLLPENFRAIRRRFDKSRKLMILMKMRISHAFDL